MTVRRPGRPLAALLLAATAARADPFWIEGSEPVVIAAGLVALGVAWWSAVAVERLLYCSQLAWPVEAAARSARLSCLVGVLLAVIAGLLACVLPLRPLLGVAALAGETKAAIVIAGQPDASFGRVMWFKFVGHACGAIVAWAGVCAAFMGTQLVFAAVTR